MSYVESTRYTIIGPEPAEPIGFPKNPQNQSLRPDRYFMAPSGPEDPRVKWGKRATKVLKKERQSVLRLVKRNWELYKGDHWDPARINNVPWKVASKINYCYFVPEHYAAMLTDHKPKATFSAYNQNDADLASIMTAAHNEWYETEHVQEFWEMAALMEQLEMVTYGHPYYDPTANGGAGAIKVKNVSVENLFMDKRATRARNADIILYEYVESRGAVLAKFPELADKLSQRDENADGSGDETASGSVYGRDSQPQPAESTIPNNDASLFPSNPPPGNTATIYSPAYSAPSSPPEDWLREGITVQEFWLRHKGPEWETNVERVVYTAGNEISTRPRLIRKANGDLEPLQRVLTAGGIMYELPMSTAQMFKFGSDYLNGLKVERVTDSKDVVTEDISVPLYPNGRRMVIVGDYCADDRANPFAHHLIPFIEMHANANSKDAIGTCPVNQIADLQDYANRLFSMLLDAALQTSNPIWRLPLSEDISDDDLTNAPGAIIRETPLSLKLGRREPGPDMPAYVMQLLLQTIEQMRIIAGVTEGATGGKPKGQIASETVTQWQEQANIRTRKAMREIDRAVAELGLMYRGLCVQFMSEPQLLMYRNAAGVDKTANFVGTQLNAPMKLTVKSGSMMPQSPSARVNYLMTSGEAPWASLQEILQGLEEVGFINSASERMRDMEKAVAEVKTLMAQNPQANPMTVLWKYPGLAQMFGGGAKPKSKKAKANAGMSARAKSPSQAVA